MTPNRHEAFELAEIPYASGTQNLIEDKPLLKVGKKLMDKWAPDYLLVTLGAGGMALFPQSDVKHPIHIPTRAKQVFDVSGAGDTVMATIVLALLAGASPENAATISNAAAGVVVGRVGTSAIEAEVLEKELAML